MTYDFETGDLPIYAVAVAALARGRGCDAEGGPGGGDHALRHTHTHAYIMWICNNMYDVICGCLLCEMF